MASPPAYLLVFHGSRDRRPQQEAETLAQFLREQLPYPSLVKVASLELGKVPLAQEIRQIGEQGVKNLKIIPLFLLAGVHVREDIPQAVATAQTGLPHPIDIAILPYLGSYPHLTSLLAQQLDGFNGDGGILLAHGSRRPQSHGLIEQQAQALGLVCAYWSVPPSLGTQVEKLLHAGKKRLLILPYFLFAGGTTAAIAQTVRELQNRYPELELSLGQPFGATPQLAQIIAQAIHAIG